jgi:uncharacterized protein YsxB (DUF464 family)
VVRVTFCRDSRKRLSSVFADGHAGWANAGEDIVCAAASAILQAALLGLTDVAKIDVTAERTAGRLAMRWPDADRDNVAVDAIVATAELSIASLANDFPEHVRYETASES